MIILEVRTTRDDMALNCEQTKMSQNEVENSESFHYALHVLNGDCFFVVTGQHCIF